MEWLSDILGIGASVASGGLLGLFGAIGGGVAKYFQEKQRQEFERSKWAHETELQKLQMQRSQVETENELAIVSQSGSWQGMNSSIIADSSVSSNIPWVNAVRSLFRPFLTVGLWGLVMSVFVMLVNAFSGSNNLLAQVLTNTEISDILKYIIYSIVFSASTATVWWFGDRALTPPVMKNR